MTAKDCINGKAQAGQVNKDKTARLVELFDELEAEARGTTGPGDAAAVASRDTEIALAREVKQRKRRTIKQLRAQSEILSRARQNPDQVERAMLSVLDFDPRGKIAGPNVSIQSQVIRGRAHAHMVDFIEQFRSKSAGFRRRKAGMRSIVRELFGESSDDMEAKALASGIREGMEYLRKSFNAAGGDIPKRTNWGLPQIHNRRTVAAVPRDEWIDFVIPRLNREQMTDLDFGRPMTDKKLRRVLADTYDNIVSDGLVDLQPGGFARPGIVRKRQESRFLIFQNADMWLDYQERFGDSDPFNIILGHVEAMARDTALIQVMGPTPEASLRFMENLIDQSRGVSAIESTGTKAAKEAGNIGNPKRALRDTYNVLNGNTNRPGNTTVANLSAANRNILTAAMLGSAFFSALSDRTFTNITARINGIAPAKTLARHLKLLSPTSIDDQKLAVRLGFGAQGWSATAIGAQRYLGEVIGPEWSQRVADSVLRLSLLSPWTQAGRWGFMTEMAGMIYRAGVKAPGGSP